MNDDDDDTLGIDLDAWQPPPPPPGIADRVLARMREETTNVSVQALPVEPERPSTRRWWLAGGAIVAAATATVVAFGLTRAPASGSGQLAAARPSHLALGPSSADLDERTVVTWRRAKHRITVQQAGGAAQWHVADDDMLTIETALGSIEATNARLRVEVKMLDEKKTIALSAATAAAVAVVTIVVYEGVVRVREPDASHEVRAGATYQIKAKDDNLIELEAPPVVGAKPLDELVIESEGLYTTPRPAAGLTREHVTTGIESVKHQIRACGGDYNGRLSAFIVVEASGRVASVEMTPSDAAPSACMAKWLGSIEFAPTLAGGKFRYPFVFAGCDAEALMEQGSDALVSQDLDLSFARFEEAYACKPSVDTERRVMLLACKVKDVTRARELFRQMDANMRDFALSTCANNGVPQEALTQEMGHLKIRNTTPAKIFVDGKAVGITPISLDLAPGKHRVTFVVGDTKHTFVVELAAGAEATLHKDISP
jgi:PEGA domain